MTQTYTIIVVILAVTAVFSLFNARVLLAVAAGFAAVRAICHGVVVFSILVQGTTLSRPVGKLNIR